MSGEAGSDGTDWKGRVVLVTGAGGFIGSHLTERLLALGATTRALVHYNSMGAWGWLDDSRSRGDIDVYLGDIRDRDTLADPMKGVDVVFHLAALIAIPYSYRSPLSYVRSNVEGTLNVLEAARRHGVERVVHTSTSEVYGTALRVPIDEAHPLQGQSPYSASKIGADMMAESFHRAFGLDVATIRPFNTYGPRQSARAVIPTIITQALTRDRVELGSLAPTRDFNYVADTVEGFLAVASARAAVGRVTNIGSGREISIEELAKTILGQVGRDLPLVSDDDRLRPAASEVDRLLADASVARELLGWSPRHTLEEGLGATIAWMREHGDRYRPTQYTV